MRKLFHALAWGCLLCSQPITGQNADFPNAIHAKLNINEFHLIHPTELEKGPRLGQGFEVSYFRNVAPFLNVGVPFNVSIAKLPNKEGNTPVGSANVVLQLLNTRSTAKLVPYAMAGAGYQFESGNNHMHIPLGVGLNFKVSPFAFVNVQAEYRKSFTELRDHFQVGAGFVFLLHKSEGKGIAAPDGDKDGVPDVLDKCPAEAGTAAAAGCPDNDNDGISNMEDICPNDPGPATTKGCPDYDSDGVPDKDDPCQTVAGTLNGCPDNDKDGFADHVDNCPDVAGTVKGCPDADNDGVADKDDKCPKEAGVAALQGCPQMADDDGDGVPNDKDQCPEASGTVAGCPDSDRDGVADKDDKCPQAAGPKANNGCPTMKDTDGDGVEDINDPCPTAAGPAKYKGCPDSDGDGVADNDDKCPNTPGTNMGCPEIKKEVRERLEFAMKAVQFQTGRAVLKQESYAILDEVATILRQYPDYKLSIEGHTDDVGEEKSNLLLSINRAQACFDYLLTRNIPKERMNYTGFGERLPLSDNNTTEGRERNRRVEFRMVL
jgi:outer membrane protein OmpA-like peptidoglycan-associated protein